MYWKRKNKEARARIEAALEDSERFGKKSLAVFDSHEKKFKEIVRKIGYGIKFE